MMMKKKKQLEVLYKEMRGWDQSGLETEKGEVVFIHVLFLLKKVECEKMLKNDILPISKMSSDFQG